MKLSQTKYQIPFILVGDLMRIKVREKCGCSITPWAIPTEDTICTGPNLECAHTIQAQIGQYSTVLE